MTQAEKEIRAFMDQSLQDGTLTRARFEEFVLRTLIKELMTMPTVDFIKTLSKGVTMSSQTTDPTKRRREDASEKAYHRARILAMQHGLELRQCTPHHYRLARGKEWGLNIYPTTGKLHHDKDGVTRRVKRLDLGREWTVGDVVKAAINAEDLQPCTMPGIPMPEHLRVSAEGLVDEIERERAKMPQSQIAHVSTVLAANALGMARNNEAEARGYLESAISQIAEIARKTRGQMFPAPPETPVDYRPEVFYHREWKTGWLRRKHHRVTVYVANTGQTIGIMVQTKRGYRRHITAPGPCALVLKMHGGDVQARRVPREEARMWSIPIDGEPL